MSVHDKADVPSPVPNGLRLEWVAAGTINDNPRNWRRHPDKQIRALREVLFDPDIGWAGAFLFNEATGRLIDGHARRKLVDPKAVVPVLVGRWSEAAEKKILLMLDSVTAMADIDEEALRSLLEEVPAVTDDMREFTAEVDRLFLGLEDIDTSELEPVPEELQGRLDRKNPVKCPECGHEFTP